MAATIEKRIKTLEREIAALKANQNAGVAYNYDLAVAKCDEYYRCVAGTLNCKTPYNACMEIARMAFKDKRGICYQNIKPREYVKTPQDADELFSLFKRFLTLYLEYLAERRVGEWQV